MLPQTLRYRQANQRLRATAVRDLQRVWPKLDPRDLDRSFPGWLSIVALVVGSHRNTAVSLAGDYMHAFRDAVQIVPPAALPVGQFATSAGVTSVVAAKKSIANGKTVEQAMSTAFVLSAGALSRLILDAGRETVMGTAIADPECEGWERVTAGGCSFCLMLAGRGSVYSEASVDFASHSHCVVGSTVVNGPTPEFGFRRWYKGEVVVIRTSSGNDLTVTPNHPVLTGRGWVKAGMLHESDQIVERAGADLASLAVPHKQDVPSRIEDVWSALSVDGLTEVPVAAEDFHGDHGVGEGNVQVVAANRLFSGELKTVRGELVAQLVAAGAGASAPARFPPGRDLGLVLFGVRPTPASRVSGLSVSGSLFSGESRVADGLGVGTIPARQSLRFDPSGYYGSADAELFGQCEHGGARRVRAQESFRYLADAVVGRKFGPGARFNPPTMQGDSEAFSIAAEYGGHLLERLSGGVKFSRLLDYRRVDYSGHVFNLQTAEGWYEANGIIVSNCMCSAQPVYDDFSTGRASQVAEYRKSARNIPQADKDRAKRWIKDNLPPA